MTAGVTAAVVPEYDVTGLAVALDGFCVAKQSLDFCAKFTRMKNASDAGQVVVLRNTWLVVLHDKCRIQSTV